MVYVMTTCEYWQNYRGEMGSISGVQGVFAQLEDAQNELRRLRSGYMKSGLYKDISDEPGRYVSLQHRSGGYPFLDICIKPQELR